MPKKQKTVIKVVSLKEQTNEVFVPIWCCKKVKEEILRSLSSASYFSRDRGLGAEKGYTILVFQVCPDDRKLFFRTLADICKKSDFRLIRKPKK